LFQRAEVICFTAKISWETAENNALPAGLRLRSAVINLGVHQPCVLAAYHIKNVDMIKNGG